MTEGRGSLAATIRSALGIEPEDAACYCWVVAGGVLMNGGGELAWSLATGRFLARLGGESMPALYVCVSLVSILTFLLAAGGGRSGPRRLHGLVALASCLFAGMAVLPGRELAAFVFVALLVAQIYPFLNEPEYLGWVVRNLPRRASRRVAPGVAASAALGRVVGAFLAMDPLGLGSVEHLLVLAACLNGGTLLCLDQARRASLAYPGSGDEEGSEGSEGEPPPPLGESLRLVRDSPLLRKVGVLCLLSGCFFGAADYPLAVTAPAAIPGEKDLAAFYGALSMGLNLMTMVVGLFGTGHLLGRIGLGRTMAVLPAGMALAGLVGAGATGFPLAITVLVGYFLLARVAHNPASLLILGAAPPRQADSIRGLTFGVPFSTGLLVSGLVIRSTSPSLEVVYLGLLAAGALGLLVSRGSEAAYLSSLLGSLGGGDEEAPEALIPRASVRALLSSGDRELEASVVEALRARRHGDPEETLALALGKRSPEVRLRAVAVLRRAHLLCPLGSSLVEGLLLESSPEVTAEAAEQSAALGDRAQVPTLLTLLSRTSGVAAVRIAGATARLAFTREELEPALAVLWSARTAPDSAPREAALRCLGELAHPAFVPGLMLALEDPCEEVVAAAARALGRVREPSSLAALRARAGREPEGNLRDALTAAARRVERSTLDGVESILAACDRRERSRLARALEELAGGRRMRLVTRLLSLEDRTLRGLSVALVKAADGSILTAIERALRDAEGRIELDCAPLLEAALEPAVPADHPLVTLLAAAGRAPVEGVLAHGTPGFEAALGAALVPQALIPLDEQGRALRLRKLARVVGVFAEDPAARARSLDAALGASARRAEAALEVLEGSGGDPRHLPALVDLVRRARELEPCAPSRPSHAARDGRSGP